MCMSMCCLGGGLLGRCMAAWRGILRPNLLVITRTLAGQKVIFEQNDSNPFRATQLSQ